jgi:AcrR family transcriptional regulator
MKKSEVNTMDTKSKILTIANQLFARNGFDGVSIRDIAQKADVNVASVNYHFKNKLNLLHEIFNYNYGFIEEEITKITEGSKLTTVELSWKIFELFMSNGSALINGFKIILSDHLTPPIGDEDEKTLGPPGGLAILKVITEEVGDKIPLKAREWTVRMLISNIFHNAAIMNSTYCKTFHGSDYWMDHEYKKFELEQFTKALMQQMVSHAGEWPKA